MTTLHQAGGLPGHQACVQETWDAEELTKHKPLSLRVRRGSAWDLGEPPLPQRPCSACLGWPQLAMGHVSGSGSQSTELGEGVDLGLRGGKLVTD